MPILNGIDLDSLPDQKEAMIKRVQEVREHRVKEHSEQIERHYRAEVRRITRSLERDYKWD